MIDALMPGVHSANKSGSRLMIALFVLSLAGTANVLGQSKELIGFDALLKSKQSKKFAWSNPDSSHEEIEILQMGIPVDDQIRSLTTRFMIDNYGQKSIWVKPRMIVIHSMDLDDLKASLEQSSFLDRTMPPEWTTQFKAGPLPSGAHFIVDRDGTIYCLTPPSSTETDTKTSYDRDNHKWLIRRHVDAIPVALGIENVTKKNDRFDDLTDEQIISNAKLVRWLIWMEKGSVKYVMSHHQFNDTTRFETMMKKFSIAPPRPLNRAWTRKDVGDAVLQKIVIEVKMKGWHLADDL